MTELSPAQDLLDGSLNEQTEHTKDIVTGIKNDVELALRTLQASGDDITDEYLEAVDKDSSSISPAKYIPHFSTITSPLRTGEGRDNNDFLSNCGDFTAIVQIALNRKGIVTTPLNTFAHESLTILKQGVNVYVDASIGQLLKDHPTIFVGTKQDLINTVTDAYNEQRMVNLDYYSTPDVGVLSSTPSSEEILATFWNIQPEKK